MKKNRIMVSHNGNLYNEEDWEKKENLWDHVKQTGTIADMSKTIAISNVSALMASMYERF